MKRMVFVSAIFSVAVAPACIAKGNPDSLVPLDDVVRLMDQRQSEIRAAETALAPIRSQADLDRYIHDHQSNPLNALSERSRDLFLSSLMFTKAGLASYRTAEIESELTPREAYAILSLFGVQGSIARLNFQNVSDDELEALRSMGPGTDDDHAQYRCMPPATCITAMDMICIGQNCKGGVP